MLVVPLTFSIDAGTYIVSLMKKRFWRKGMLSPQRSVLFIVDNGKICVLRGNEAAYSPMTIAQTVSVIIPAYNEGASIEATVKALFNQTLRPINVIIVDDCSTDETPIVCQSLQEELGEDLIYTRREKNSGKANNINYAVNKFGGKLGSITLVNDSDTITDKRCVEILARRFVADDIAAVTPYGYTLSPHSPLARALHYGNAWNNRIFKFRKKAQEFRYGISVVCGACTAFNTDVLKRLPIPERTKTEDTDYTWILQENGYKILYDERARAYSHDIERPTGLLRQWYRWYSGVMQSIFVHGRDLLKAKSMFWTTVLPALLESVPYSLGVATLPIFAAVNLLMTGSDLPIFSMTYVKGFLLADFLFTIIPTAIISPKYLLRLHQIYIFKYVASVLTMIAYTRTVFERITGRQHMWSNVWSRKYSSEL